MLKSEIRYHNLCSCEIIPPNAFLVMVQYTVKFGYWGFYCSLELKQQPISSEPAEDYHKSLPRGHRLKVIFNPQKKKGSTQDYWLAFKRAITIHKWLYPKMMSTNRKSIRKQVSGGKGFVFDFKFHNDSGRRY